MALTIRIAQSSDNERLIRLARECPMKGILTLYVDRAPDFFFLNKLQGDEWRVYVAEENGELLGSLSVAYRQAFVGGNECRVAYLSDVKIPPKYRGSTVAYRLLSGMFENERSNEFDYFICSALKGNTTVIKLFSGRAGLPALFPVGVVKVVNVIPTRFGRWRGKTVARRANDRDVERIVMILNQFHAVYNFSPVFKSDSFRHMVQTSLGLHLHDYYIIEEAGSIIAVASCWDQGANKRLIVERHSMATRALVLASGVGNMVGIMPRLPGEGEPLKVLQIRHIAFAEGKRHAEQELISFLVDRARSEGYDLVQLSVAAGDERLLSRSLAVPISLEVYCGSLLHDVSWLKSKKVYEDVCLV